MNKKNVKLYRLCALATMIISFVSAVLICSAADCYDEKLQHYAAGAIIPVIGFVCAGIAVIPAIIAAIAARASSNGRDSLAESEKSDGLMLYPRFLAAAFFTAEFFSLILSSISSSLSVITTAVALSAICSAVAMLVKAFPPKNSRIVAAFSLFPIIWSIFSMLNVYFSKELALNSPHKSMMLICYIYTVFMFIAEARFANRRQKAPFFVFSSIVSMAAVALTVPLLTASIKKAVAKESGMPGMSLVSAVLLTALCIFAIFRAIDTSLGHLKKTHPTVNNIADDSRPDSNCGAEE